MRGAQKPRNQLGKERLNKGKKKKVKADCFACRLGENNKRDVYLVRLYVCIKNGILVKEMLHGSGRTRKCTEVCIEYGPQRRFHTKDKEGFITLYIYYMGLVCGWCSYS